MKKKTILGLSLCSLLAFGGLLTSCEGKTSSSSTPTSNVAGDQTTEILNAAMNKLSVPTEVSEDFNLTVNAAGGVKISWTSNNEAIKVDGNIATVSRSTSGDVDVVLTAVGKLGEKQSEPKTFNVKVKKLEVSVPEGSITVKEAKESEVGKEVTVTGVVSAHVGGVNKTSGAYSANGFYLTDATETVYVYGYMVANKVERGDYVCITATVAEYNGAIQLTTPTLLNDAVLSKNMAIPAPDAYAVTGKTIDEIYNPTNNPGLAGKTYIFDCYVITYSGATYTNYEICTTADGKGKYMNIYSSASDLKCPENAWLDQYVEAKQLVKVAFYINSANSKGTSYRGNVIYVY